jgi:signal transduction histidine kinase
MSLYWKCQILGWSLYGLVSASIPMLFGGLRWPVVGRVALGAVLGLVLTDQLRRHIRRRGWLRLPLRRLLPRITGASLAVAALMVAGILPFLVLFIPGPGRAGPMAAVFLTHAAMVLGWSSLYLGYHYLQGVRAAEAERWRLELAMRDAELHALRAQLNPHFLFNSLNSLRGLVTEDPERAQESITGLAALLRYTLRLSRGPTTTLERELEAVRHYLELEALRFESRLRYRIDVDPHALEHAVPPLLVQTLVENAIKHGIGELPEGGSVRIEARQNAGELRIRVANTGRLPAGQEPGGIGLANSLDRLRLMFGEQVALRLTQSATDEVTCEVVLPSAAPVPAFMAAHRDDGPVG